MTPSNNQQIINKTAGNTAEDNRGKIRYIQTSTAQIKKSITNAALNEHANYLENKFSNLGFNYQEIMAIMYNYHQIKNDVKNIIEKELNRINEDPDLKYLLDKKTKPDKSTSMSM